MIRFTLDELMFRHKVKVPEVSKETSINKNTLYAMQNNNMTRVDLSVLDRLCTYFECDVSELLVKEKH